MTHDSLIEKFNGVRITDEMKQRAIAESEKREPDIMHHFTTDALTQEQTDQIGFYGEFAFRELLKIDWEEGIRENYKTIDSNDLNLNGWAMDVKTESIPEPFFWSVIDKSIEDNEWFGRRLFHTGQQTNLKKYDLVMIGAVKRENDFADIDVWFPIGWIQANQIPNYTQGKKGPLHHSGKKNVWYPFSAFQVTTADLKPISELIEFVKQTK